MLTRKALILYSIEDEKCPYHLELDELKLLDIIVKSRQIPLINLGNSDDEDVGSFIPITIMRDEKK